MIKGKTSRDEHFPVGLLLKRRLKPFVQAYYHAARFADDIADNPMLTGDEKLKALALIRQAFLHPASGNDLPDIRNLGRLFVSEELDASLFLDLLTAFEQDAMEKPIRIWDELLAYCRYSAAPVGRFILALHDETPSAYLPAENLCAILQILNHLHDIKEDLSRLNRCYFPSEMLQSCGVRREDLGLNQTLPGVQTLFAEVLKRLEAMQIDAGVLPCLIKDFQLRLEVCVILSLTNFMIQKNKKTNILQFPQSPSIWDWSRALVLGLYRACLVRPKQKGRVL